MNIIKVSLIISLILISNLLSYNFSNRIYNYLSSLDIYQTEENIERAKKIRSNNNLAEEEKEIIDMIVALLSIKIKNNYEMEKCLLNIIREGRIFRDYAVLFLSEYYIKKKEYNKARELIIRELRENETILIIEFYKMLMDINTKTGMSNNITYYETLVKYIQEDEYFLERYKTELKEYEYRLAELYYKNNLKYEALNIIKKIIINGGAYKRDSIKLLQQMIKSNKNLMRELNDEIISEIIKENIVNKNYKEAIAYTEEIKNIKDKILLQVNCYIKMRYYKKAEKILENIKGSREYKLKKAEIYNIKKQTNKAKENLIEIIKEDKRDRNEERALEMILEILYKEGRYKEAMKYYNYLATYYPENDLLSEYLWNIGFCFFERREFDEAEKCFRMLAEFQRNKYIESDEKARVLFWVALSNEKNNRYGEAIKIYNEIITNYPFTFYAYRSLEKFNECKSEVVKYSNLTNNEENDLFELNNRIKKFYNKPRVNSYYASFNIDNDYSTFKRRFYEYDLREIELNQQYNNKIKEHLLKHYIFKQIGFNKISIDELEYIYNQTKDENVKYNIAMIYSKNGEYNKSINLIEKIVLSSNNYEFNYCNFPAEIKDILYPRYWYNDLIEKNAVYYNINSYLIRALIREESRYNFKAVSNANAYGLMQIIPATGKWIARKLGFNYFKNYQLYQPSINISFGTYYLSVLLEKYNKDVIKALAAYNGGGGNVDGWLKRLKINDVDYFVEKIPFSETKNYVKNVLKSFYIYNLIYSGDYGIEYSYNKTNNEVNEYD